LYTAEIAVRTLLCSQDAISWYLSYNSHYSAHHHKRSAIPLDTQPSIPKSETRVNVFCPVALADIYRTRPTHSRYQCIHERVSALGRGQKCKKRRKKEMHYWYYFLTILCEILFELSLLSSIYYFVFSFKT